MGQQPLEITHKKVLKIAVPMTLAYLTTPLLGMVDTYLIGQLGDAEAIAAIAVGALLYSVLFTSFNFLRMSTTALTAQSLGRGDLRELHLILFRGLILALGLGLVAFLMHQPIIKLGLWGIGATEGVNQYVWTYLTIRLFAAPLTLMNYVAAGWFMGLGRGWTSLAHQLILNLTNIVFSAIFVLYWDMGVAGVAWGTVVGEAVGFLVACIIYFYNNKLTVVSFYDIFEKQAIKQMLSMNSNILIRSFILLASFYIFTRMSAKGGTETLAANEILLHFFYLAGYFLDGCAVAAEQLCGQAKGARQKQAFRQAAMLTSLWNVIMACLLMILFIFIVPKFITEVTPNLEVQKLALTYSIWVIIIPLTGVMAFQMDGIFFGAGWATAVRQQMIASLIIFIILLWIFSSIFTDQNIALWLSFHGFIISRWVILLWMYFPNERRSFES